MADSPVPLKLSWIKRLAVWLYDFARMPGRIAELHAQRDASTRRVEQCPNCDARMKVIYAGTDKSVDRWQFQCDACHARIWKSYRPQ